MRAYIRNVARMTLFRIPLSLGATGMELPHRYPYNPRLRLILLVFGSGLLWMAVQWLSWGHIPSGFSLWFGFIPIVLALIVGVRRISVERYLLLDKRQHGTSNRFL